MTCWFIRLTTAPAVVAVAGVAAVISHQHDTAASCGRADIGFRRAGCIGRPA
jgi:hypothetical protein